MNRARALLLSALAAASSACGSSQPASPSAALRRPSAIALFQGVTLDDPDNLQPYLAVASASRDEIALVDARDGTPVLAPIRLRTLVVPVPDRPAILASASLGDGKADLLVVAAAGDTRVQLVHTWSVANDVEESETADLGFDVLALAAVPSVTGTARVAAALAGGRLAMIEYARSGDGIALQSFAVNPLPFQPIALAAVPGDGSHVYAATLDEVTPGVFGVGEVDVSSAAGPWPVRAIDARGPTRLVAAASLQERKDGSAADDAAAFEGEPVVPRVYAVLDESGCGVGKRIDCGIATLDPVLGRIPDDPTDPMPYRAPIRLPGKTRALAIAPTPEEAGVFRRLYRGTSELATTAVGAAASERGDVVFLDLGRFKVATLGSPLDARGVTVSSAAPEDGQRLWLVKDDGSFPATEAEAAELVAVTPGWTTGDAWTVTYQGVLPDLSGKAAEAGRIGTGEPWLALQRGEVTSGGARVLREVVRLYHPALGVAAGDLALVASSLPGCEAFEAEILELLPPTAAYEGGAVRLGQLAGHEACFSDLQAAVAAGDLITDLTATIRARGFLLTSTRLGYAGRPQPPEVPDLPGELFTLEYPGPGQDEDDLEALCPLAGWDGSFPASLPACTATCRADCERLVLARKARRFHHLAEECPDQACSDRWPGLVFPDAVGPVIRLRVGVEGAAEPRRSDADFIRIATSSSGATPQSTRPASGSPVQPNGALAFDRSATDPTTGYRFFVSFPADFVLDTSPGVSPLESKIIR